MNKDMIEELLRTREARHQARQQQYTEQAKEFNELLDDPRLSIHEIRCIMKEIYLSYMPKAMYAPLYKRCHTYAALIIYLNCFPAFIASLEVCNE